MALTPTRTDPADKKAKIAAATDDVLMREVDEAVRKDDMAQFGKRFGVPIIAALVVGLAAFGGYLYYNHTQEQARERNSEALIAALDQQEAGNLSAASQAFAPLASGNDGASRAIALMGQAGIAVQDGKTAEAARLFAQVADDPDAPGDLRELARVRQVATQYDQLAPAEVVRLLDASAKPGRPFFPSAGEMVAMALLEQGKRSEAGAMFAAVAKDSSTPETLQSRARQMAGLLGVDAVVEPENNVATGAGRTEGNAQPAT